MTELALAYGWEDPALSYGGVGAGAGQGVGGGGGQGVGIGSAPPTPMVQTTKPQPAPPIPAPSPAAMQEPTQSYNPPNAMYQMQGGAGGSGSRDTFWDRLAYKRWEIIKFVVLALVVVLALSIDRISTHYLDNYINKGFLTPLNELVVRLSYPLIVILLLWIIKASF